MVSASWLGPAPKHLACTRKASQGGIGNPHHSPWHERSRSIMLWTVLSFCFSVLSCCAEVYHPLNSPVEDSNLDLTQYRCGRLYLHYFLNGILNSTSSERILLREGENEGFRKGMPFCVCNLQWPEVLRISSFLRGSLLVFMDRAEYRSGFDPSEPIGKFCVQLYCSRFKREKMTEILRRN